MSDSNGRIYVSLWTTILRPMFHSAASPILLDNLIDDEGYNVIGARNYPEMAAELQKARPALILLDYMMPGENGIEICRILKNDAELESIPIVMVSAVDDSDTIAEGIEAGAIDWVPKPVDDEAILEHVCLAVG